MVDTFLIFLLELALYYQGKILKPSQLTNWIFFFCCYFTNMIFEQINRIKKREKEEKKDYV